MGKHRIRRWFQFGVLDLLLATTIVAIVAVLWRPVHPEENKAAPWVIGGWSRNDGHTLSLFPDGFYLDDLDGKYTHGFGWRITRQTTGSKKGNTFVLSYGDHQTIVREGNSTDILEVLNDDGITLEQWERSSRLEGLFRDGVADGRWSWFVPSPNANAAEAEYSLQYHHGEIVDLRAQDGEQQLEWLNALRAARRLPSLKEKNLP